MVYHVTFANEDADGSVHMHQSCKDSFDEVLDYLVDAGFEYKIVAFSCIRKFVKEV